MALEIHIGVLIIRDPTIWGTILGVPYFVNPHISNSFSVQAMGQIGWEVGAAEWARITLLIDEPSRNAALL